jgi:hypothetical protein
MAGDMQARIELKTFATQRIEKLQIGDPITNICAGDTNPHRLAYFVGITRKSRKNKYGIVHHEIFVRCSKNGKNWDAGIEVIYPGHLSVEESRLLFEPVWQSVYG